MKNTQRKPCPFCNPKIIKNQKVYETDTEFVLYNFRKCKNPGRCIVIPKRHVASLRDLNKKETESIFQTIQKVARKIAAYYKPDGINYGINEGEIAGQTVFHLHIHIIPRYAVDELPEYHLFHGDPKTKGTFSDEELETLRTNLKKVINTK